MKVRNVNPLGVGLRSTCEASVDPGCSRSQVMGRGSSQKRIRNRSLLLDRPWEKLLDPFLKRPPFVPIMAFWIACFNKWGNMSSVGVREEDRMMFSEATSLGRHPQFSPLLERVIFLAFVRSEPRVRLNMQLPFETSNIYAESGSRVAMTHSTGLVTMSWGHDASRGMRELWCPIWLAASRAGHPGAERVLERFSPWRKDKTFKLPNKLFKFSLAKTERLKRKNLALAIRWGSRDILWFIIKDFILLATLQSC